MNGIGPVPECVEYVPVRGAELELPVPEIEDVELVAVTDEFGVDEETAVLRIDVRVTVLFNVTVEDDCSSGQGVG